MLHDSVMMNYKSKIINHWDLQARHNLRLFLTSRSSSIILFQNDLNTVAILLLYLYTHTYCKLVHLMSIRTTAMLLPDHCSSKKQDIFQSIHLICIVNKSDHCLACHSVSSLVPQPTCFFKVRWGPCLLSQSLLLLNFAQIFEFIKVVRWISVSSYMDLTKLIHGILQVVTWIWQSCYMDL